MNGNGEFPRELKRRERDLLLWILPEDRPGYRTYRECIDHWKVIGTGRRGAGSFVLSNASLPAAEDTPEPQLLAYGVIETGAGVVSVSIREKVQDQVEFEIAPLSGGEGVFDAGEIRRWTYSTWLPGAPCPACLHPVREVPLGTSGNRDLRLSICARDERSWVYDGAAGVNRIIPVTGFYNELMLHKGIRDPRIALDSRRLFSELPRYSDHDLAFAFQSYNRIRSKVVLEKPLVPEETHRRSLRDVVRAFLERLKHRSDKETR